MSSAAFHAFVAFFRQLGIWLLDGILYLVKFLLYTLVDGILTIITAFFQGLELVNSAGSFVADWSGLPPQMGYLIGHTGIPACITLVMAAITIRVLINLIPSWATRV